MEAQKKQIMEQHKQQEKKQEKQKYNLFDQIRTQKEKFEEELMKKQEKIEQQSEEFQRAQQLLERMKGIITEKESQLNQIKEKQGVHQKAII